MKKQMQKQDLKNELKSNKKGITLVALVITIVY